MSCVCHAHMRNQSFQQITYQSVTALGDVCTTSDISSYKASVALCDTINHSGITPYSLRASASHHMEEYTCNSKGGNHQKPQTHPTEQLV
jgi:hypothetical protein